jgi:hypothetical protein
MVFPVTLREKSGSKKGITVETKKRLESFCPIHAKWK